MSENLRCELEAYRRGLSRLLAGGQAGRWALVRGVEVVSVWDTQRDAIQASRDRFGPGPVLVKRIDPRDPARFVRLDAMVRECGWAC